MNEPISFQISMNVTATHAVIVVIVLMESMDTLVPANLDGLVSTVIKVSTIQVRESVCLSVSWSVGLSV